MRTVWRAIHVIILLSAMLFALPAQAQWRRAESVNFVVYSTGSESRLRQRVELLEDFDRFLRLMTTVNAPPTPNKLHIYIVDGFEELRRLYPVSPNTAGYYIATPDGIAAFVDGRAEFGGNEILFHEYVHHFMMQYAPNAYPAWYVEGFAEYLQTVRLRPRQIDIGNYSEGRVYSITEGVWLPIDRVLFGDTRGLNAEQTSSFYAQSWLITHFFHSTPERQAALRRYLALSRQGDPAAALQASTGMEPAAFHDALRRYIRGGTISYRRMTREPPGPAEMTITALPRSAGDFILFEAGLRIGIPEDNREERLRQIRATAARHADDPFAMRVLAHAELLYGDAPAADRLLDRLIESSPGDAELLYLKGMRHLIVAENGDDWDEEAAHARRWFARAHEIDGNHYQTLFRYAQSMRGTRDFVSENTANILLLAHQLAPQVSTIRMNAAAMLMSRRNYAEAERMLRPLAADPHNSGLADAARQMREEAIARMSGATTRTPPSTDEADDKGD